MEKQITLTSLIKKYFTPEIYRELYKITLMCNTSNNMRGDEIKNILTQYNIPFSPLGSGTNRIAVLIDGYAVKIALDKDGMIDNRREMLYSKALQPYVVKVYECTITGLIAVTEYITIFTIDDFRRRQDDIRSILKRIASEYFIGDVGVTSKNYVNWGTRNDGSICILDFAYIYSVKYNLFTCNCEQAPMIEYDENFVDLLCPACGKRYTFSSLRRKIGVKDQEKEIGDISRLGYNLRSAIETHNLNPEFTPIKQNVKKEKKKKPKDTRVFVDIHADDKHYYDDIPSE